LTNAVFLVWSLLEIIASPFAADESLGNHFRRFPAAPEITMDQKLI
jgi:hypothetical protein